ncbi:MAG: hypothetical protein C0600_03300 [Ignavibacteria bacterium]|nr:MAG: hypothetical protein C0600_03300 [Ignavibacteria bacterium]
MMKQFFLLCMIASLALSAEAQTRQDTTIIAADDVVLDAFYIYPSTPAPPGGYPAVLLVHGFGGSKNNNASLARGFNDAGYVATAYSVRGQGASGGMFDFFTSENLLSDLQTMINFTKALPDVRADRVGVMGGSQGGIHAWNAAAYDMGVQAVVSVVANGRFRENWLEDNALNWTFAAATLSSSVNFDPAVLDSITRARESGDFTYMRSYLENASTKSRESGVTTPVAIFVSYYDGFFDPSAALRQFANVAGPKRIVLYPAGHSMPSDPAQATFVNDVVARWMDYWLKGDESLASVASPDSAVVMFDAGNGEMHVYAEDEPEYWLMSALPLPEEVEELPLYFTDEGLRVRPQVTRSQRVITYVNLIGSQAQLFSSEPLPKDMTISAVTGSVRLQLSGTGSQLQTNVLLFDVDPTANTRVPITRGHLQQEGGTGVTATFELNTTVHTVRAGHVIEAQVHGGMALLPNQDRDFGNYVMGPVDNSVNSISFGGDTESAITLRVLGDTPVGVREDSQPLSMDLAQNYPNPFTPSTTLPFSLAQAGYCRLSVYDTRGREVAVLHDGDLAGGRYTAHFLSGNLPAGMYIAVLRGEEQTIRRSMLLVR